MLHSAVLNVMIKAARRAGRSLKRDLGEIEHLQVSLKGPRNFVTAADRRAEQIVYEELAKARPAYGFLGEEGGARAMTLEHLDEPWNAFARSTERVDVDFEGELHRGGRAS